MSTVPIPSFVEEGVIGRRLQAGDALRRVVVIRLHAFGDAIITIPVLAGLRELLPDAHIEFITSTEYAELFESLDAIDSVVRFPARASKPQRLATMAMLATHIGSPDLLLDLQRSAPSLLLGRMLRPRAWVAFDRFAPRSALDRYFDSCHWVGLHDLQPRYRAAVRQSVAEEEALVLRRLIGADKSTGGPLVCLNPAGSWPTKNWPVSHYIRLAEMMMEEWNAHIVMLGTDNVRQGADELRQALGDRVIDLVGRTTLSEAFAVVRNLDLMVSDDSGLMHMAWVSGVPTVGIFGASRSIWSRPCGDHSFCFGSEDLECGACMSDVCSRGDLLCLQRVSPEAVMEQCRKMIQH